MLTWRDLPYIHRFLLIVGGFYVLDAASIGLVSEWLRLSPLAVLQNLQLWRLITYPFASPPGIDAIFTLFTSSLVFFYYGPEIENILGKRRLMFYIGAFLLLHGVLYTAIAGTTGYPLAGLTTVALSLLVGFHTAFPQSVIRLFGTFSLRTITLLVFLALLNAFPHLLSIAYYPDRILVLLADDIIALFTGIVLGQFFLHNRTSQVSKNDEEYYLYNAAESDFGYREYVVQPQESLGMMQSEQRMQRDLPDYRDENRLNEILDKISANGTQSLSAQEKEYLQEYSKRL